MTAKVSGFTLVRNGEQFDYPYLQSLASLLPLVDELVMNVGVGDDSTLARVREFAASALKAHPEKTITVFESDWRLDDSERKKSGKILSEQTNLALDRCTGDWAVYLQADEVLHERDCPQLRASLETFAGDSEVEALVFEYRHFYGSYDVVQRTRSAYRREVRAVKKSSGARSVGDAQSFRKADGSKLRAAFAGARIFHYGWVRTPQAMREKTLFMDRLYHGDSFVASGTPPTGENYRYKRFWGLQPYTETHPGVMFLRIRQQGWHWDLKASPFVWEWADLIKILLDTFEKISGIRLFEYRCYRLLPRTLPLVLEWGPPAASILLATYEMPRHLALVLAGLEHQTFQDFEVMVCDDGSGPETRAIIDDFRARSGLHVEHVWQEHQGFRKCRMLNEGVRRSRGRVLIFLDGDCIPEKHFVADHMVQQQDGTYLAGRRVELGRKLSESLTVADVREGMFDRLGIKLLLSFFAKEGSEHLNRCFRFPWPWLRKLLKMDRVVDLKGCNYSVPREALIAINGFDEKYEGYGREDTDAEIRFQNLGLKIKSLKGLALQYHVWHPRREFTPANDQRLEDLKISRRYDCEEGLTQDLSQ